MTEYKDRKDSPASEAYKNSSADEAADKIAAVFHAAKHGHSTHSQSTPAPSLPVVEIAVAGEHKEQKPHNNQGNGGELTDWNRNLNLSSIEEKHGLDKQHKHLLNSVLLTESDGKADAVSSKGAAGLFQITPIAAKHYHIENPKNPKEAADGAARMFADLGEKFKDKRDLMLAAYNYGETNVRKAVTAAKAESQASGKYVDWHSKLPAETTNFIQEVRERMRDSHKAEKNHQSTNDEQKNCKQGAHISDAEAGCLAPPSAHVTAHQQPQKNNAITVAKM